MLMFIHKNVSNPLDKDQNLLHFSCTKKALNCPSFKLLQLGVFPLIVIDCLIFFTANQVQASYTD